MSDLTRVKSGKHQPQRKDVVGDSVKPGNALVDAGIVSLSQI